MAQVAGMQREDPHALNQRIEKLIQLKDEAHESYSMEEIAFIQGYSGSGGLASKGATGTGVLYEFYTPEWLVPLMWQLAQKHGFKGGPVLEPACGTGRLISAAPEVDKVVGFETNPISRRIAEISYPGATFHQGYFESAFMQPPRYTSRLKGNLTWLRESPFSLVIGNPPFGKYKNLYSSYFNSPRLETLESFFIYYGLKLLRPGGLLVYLLSSNFLRNGDSYNRAKEEIETLGDMVDAYRLPPVMERTDVPVDILILRKK